MTEIGASRRRIVDELKRRGDTSARAIAKILGVTSTAVRQHLDRLEVMGLVERSEVVQTGSRGRPGSRWRLSELANELFPDRHGELTVDLIESVRDALGEEGLGAVVKRRTERQSGDYLDSMAGRTSVADRIERLAEIRTSEGYMAEVTGDDGGYFFTEHHCPICEAATACQGLCAGELELFENVLGDGATVERIEHALSGDTRCVYRVTPVSIT